MEPNNGPVERSNGAARTPHEAVRVRTSKDGTKFIVEVIQTWIFPSKYIGTILANAGKPWDQKVTNNGNKPLAA